ncbi:MAG: S24 family peptidase [Sphingomonadales bacterium]|jgi:phage repressor protein C with HTH and peptisase S24 domain
MISSDDIRRKLDQLIHDSGHDYASVSRYLGRNSAYVQQFIKRGVPRRLKEEDRQKLAVLFEVPEQELGALRTSNPQATPEVPIRERPIKRYNDDFVFVPYFDIRASAGSGSLIEKEDQKTSLAFRKEWVARVATGSADDLAILLVEGDSMDPTLAHGDLILIDTSQAWYLRDGIYVLRVDGALLVKRISVNPSTKRLTIKSDNPAYESWSNCDPTEVDPIGRVIWVGRSL